jgi:hypothetical protein
MPGPTQQVTKRRAGRVPGRIAGVLALVAIALVAGGCQSDEQHYLKDQLQPLRAKLDEQKARVGATLKQTTGTPQSIGIVNQQIDQLGAIVRRIGAIKPPDSVVYQARVYVAANAGLVKSLRAFTALLAKHPKHGLQDAAYRTQVAAGKAIKADEALQRALRE